MWVSTVLTSQAHRRRTPRTNRRIPTISAGCFGGWIVDVSAVATGPRGSESGVLGGTARRCGTTATAASDPASSAAPSPRHPGAHLLSLGGRLIARDPAPATWGPITRHQRHDLKHRALSGARAKARRSWFDADPASHRAGSAPLLPRVGLLHEGRDLLTKGCAYCTRAPPTRSTPNPPPVAPHPRAVHPDDTGRHPSSCEQSGRPHQRSEQWLPHTVGPPHRCLEMS